ncbi:MAG TPA: long-chain-acyl-CoA synthetase [Stellaceae bacterium]|nr:long-chain-acyl-CoA synthetase [Stellaceae bacterium]
MPAEDDARRARTAFLRALELTAPIRQGLVPTLPTLIETFASRSGDRVAILDDQESWSYRRLLQQMNRVARWALAAGVRKGDVVAIVMTGGAGYLATWLGLTRIGAVAALINANLGGEVLARALAAAVPSHLIIESGYEAAAEAVQRQLTAPLSVIVPGEDALAACADGALNDIGSPALDDRALYLYTSGTTGFPKAVAISHRRILEWSYWFSGIMGASERDRLYDCLPLYHAIGGISGVGAMLVSGGSVVLRKRFSARTFWPEVSATQCTIFLYIGELCRYLLSNPADPAEALHRVRLCCGSGLRGDIWANFERRFRIPQILEFYAATEGTVSLYNVEGKRGAVGRVPSFLRHRAAIALVEVDAEGNVFRGADGLCRRPAIGEAGEAVGRITDEGSGGAGRFDGYNDRDASRARILRDVFQPGDAWFRTGDLMRQDAERFFHFIDRLGDTFRWKGENVSTSEVAAALAACPGVNEAVVYGVPVPGAEGRAGMAAIVAAPGFDPVRLWRDIAARLPRYASPLFLRLVPAIETTATLRPQKQRLMREGFDPVTIRDPLYFNASDRQSFVPLDADLHSRIVAGKIRF